MTVSVSSGRANPIRPRSLSDIEFCAWVAQAAPGDRLQYHRGFLALDTFPVPGRLADRQRQDLTRLAARALWAAEQSLVHLVQERVGPDRFAYIAIARAKSKHAAASLSALLLEEQARDLPHPDPFHRSRRPVHALAEQHPHAR